MNKIAVLLTAALVAGFVSVKVTNFSLESDDEWMEEQKISERFANYQCFKQTLDHSLDALAKGSISLREAQTRVQERARRFHPLYLEWLARCENGATADERVAHNLVTHLHYAVNVFPNMEQRLREVDRELTELQGGR